MEFFDEDTMQGKRGGNQPARSARYLGLSEQSGALGGSGSLRAVHDRGNLHPTLSGRVLARLGAYAVLSQLAAQLVVAETEQLRGHCLIEPRLLQCRRRGILFRFRGVVQSVPSATRVAACALLRGCRGCRRPDLLERCIKGIEGDVGNLFLGVSFPIDGSFDACSSARARYRATCCATMPTKRAARKPGNRALFSSLAMLIAKA